VDLGVACRGKMSVGALDRSAEIFDLHARRMFPGLRASEIGDAQLAVRELLRFVLTNGGGASLGLESLLLGTALGIGRSLTCAHGVTELRRGGIDLAVAMLAQGLERVLRIPRHSWGIRWAGAGCSVYPIPTLSRTPRIPPLGARSPAVSVATAPTSLIVEAMRVAFSDPQGARLWRLFAYGGPIALFLFACFGPLLEGSNAALTACLSVALFHLVGMVPFRQGRKRTAELVTGPGFVEIKKAGTRSQRIDARSIVGGTTARTSKGVLFTLAHAKRDQPLTIEVESDADADRIRHALGIGHGGFGAVGWRTVSSSSAKTGFWGRLITFLIGATISSVGWLASPDAAGVIAIILGQFAFLSIILSMVGYFGRAAPPSIVMTAEGLRIQTKQGWFTLPYDHVLGVERVRGGLLFRVPPPYNAVEVETAGPFIGTGLGPDVHDGLIRQIMSASARARGLGTSKEDVTGRVDVLRRNGESPRDWLARLDMAGRMLEASTAGYRGHTLDTEDLWAVLEDPDADANLRAAAARVLRHSQKPETRVRIDAAVAAVRDEGTNRRLRIAIRDDVDNASQELAMLDAQEQLPPQLRQMYHR
jgi:hypothetical protein